MSGWSGFTYVGKCKHGIGRAASAEMAGREKSLAEDVASMIRSGLIVERVQEVVSLGRCPECSAEKTPQGSLFEKVRA